MPDGTRKKVCKRKTGSCHIYQRTKVPVVLLRFDYGRKATGMGPTFDLSGDMTVDMTQI